MKTVGEILQNARKKHGLSLREIANQTKISEEYLEALEKNDFSRLPAAAFTKGFIRNFAKRVGVDPKNALAIFRRDYDQDEKGRIIPRGMSEPVKSKINIFTPTTTAITLSVALGLIIVSFFVRQIVIFLSAPPLEIVAPPDNIETTSPLEVRGITKAEATLTVNGKPVTIDQDGNFATRLTLSPGQHTIVVKSTSRSDKTRTLHRSVVITQ